MPPAPAPPAAGRRTLGRAVTVVSVLVLLALVALLLRLQAGEGPLAGVEDPERALALIVGRTMDVDTALAGAPAWERRLYALTLTDTGSEIDQAIAWYEELAAASLAPGVDLRLAILLGEAGRRERLRRAVEPWRARGDPLATYADVIEAVYQERGEVDAAAAAETLGALGPGWFADALALRLAARLGEPVRGGHARQSIAARAGPLLRRLRALAALDLLLLALGGLALRSLLRRPAVADAPLPPPWPAGAGLAVLVRGAALAALLLLLLLAGGHWLAEQPLLAGTLDQPLMYLPVLLLARRTLLAPAGLGFAAAFGLRPRPDGWRGCARATLVLVAAGLVTDIGLGVLGQRLGLTSHWSEWFDATLAWGSPAEVVATVLGAVVFAPIFEELIFRGLLYGSLRSRFGWPAAALGSALIFGFAHGYGIAGFLSVFLSGVIWAYLYERTGSLLPGVAAHVANNAAVAITLLALLR
ncbi:MAG TPA: CPBP family intramembrane glutamic endopeptidase [Methylomirabilota bacterium]|nr:CPBP family intramembrane glutamic endopeptidase [Methylomirabilota bacterium]